MKLEKLMVFVNNFKGVNNVMTQRLILPINRARITAGYKNSNYRSEFGYTHYGCDLTDSKKSILTVWGSGKGMVTH